MESTRNRVGLLAWISFVAASLLILTMISSLVRNSSISFATMTIDELGAAMPFGLFAAVLTYLFLRSRFHKPAAQAAAGGILRVQGALLAATAGALIMALVFILTYFPLPVGLSGGGSKPQPTPSGSVDLAELPVFNPVLALSIFIIGAIFVVALSVTFLRVKTQVIDENFEEEIAAKGTVPIPAGVIDGEYRKAVIERYVKGRDVLAAKGVPSSESTTHREFENSVLQTAKRASNDFVPLSRLFEEARFSPHEVGPPQKSEAEKRYEKVVKTAQNLGDEND